MPGALAARRLGILGFALIAACGSGVPDSTQIETGADAGSRRTDSGAVDADPAIDAGSAIDADPAIDAGSSRCGTWSGGDPIRTLFVGNSQIEVWDLPHMVSSLADSAPGDCPRIEAARFARGGANLRDLWEQPQPDGTTLQDAIATGDYDVVVLAESIDLAERLPGFPDLFVEYATRIELAARASGALPVLYATPYIERDGHRGFHEQAGPQLAFGEAEDVVVAAGGLAWLRVWDELPAIDLYHRDRQHPGFRGSYVSALVIYAAITGAAPVGLTLAPESGCEGDGVFCGPIDAHDGAVMQRAAWAQHLETGVR